MMDSQQFEQVFEETVAMSRHILIEKAKEYATDGDRLHNFIIAGLLQDVRPTVALGGMMSKHTVSVYDMINDADETWENMEKWDEKLLDHINYLILLRACVIDAANQARVEMITTAVAEAPTGEPHQPPVGRSLKELRDESSPLLRR